MTEQPTENAANIRKTFYLSQEVVDWIEAQAKRENRNVSNYIETYFMNIITLEAGE